MPGYHQVLFAGYRPGTTSTPQRGSFDVPHCCLDGLDGLVTETSGESHTLRVTTADYFIKLTVAAPPYKARDRARVCSGNSACRRRLGGPSADQILACRFDESVCLCRLFEHNETSEELNPCVCPPCAGCATGTGGCRWEGAIMHAKILPRALSEQAIQAFAPKSY